MGLSDGRLAWGLAPPAVVPALADRMADTRDGDVVEVCPALPGIMGEVGRRIAAHGGAALLVDYGGWHLTGDSFQAVRRHAYADPLEAPGEADLTAHVDFEALARVRRPGRRDPHGDAGRLPRTPGNHAPRAGPGPRPLGRARSPPTSPRIAA